MSSVLALTKSVPWYGAATGYYSMLPPALRDCGCQVETVAPRSGLAVRIAGKLWSWSQGLPARHQSLAFAEWQFLRRFDRTRAPGLMLAIEDNLPLLTLRRFQVASAPRRLIGVIHYPPAFWTEAMRPALSRLRSALVLYRSDIPFFETLVGRGRVRFAPHGVDTAHFCPSGERPSGPPRLLVSGQFGRDFELLAEVFPRVRRLFPDATLELVGAHHVRAQPAVQALAAMPGVTVHGMSSDAELLELYRRCTLMLLPLEAAGANNALVEALACGAPMVATDTGGVRDYGGGELFPIVARGDVGAFATAVTDLLSAPARRAAMSEASRVYAERELTWRRAAEQHLDAIRQLTAEEEHA